MLSVNIKNNILHISSELKLYGLTTAEVINQIMQVEEYFPSNLIEKFVITEDEEKKTRILLSDTALLSFNLTIKKSSHTQSNKIKADQKIDLLILGKSHGEIEWDCKKGRSYVYIYHKAKFTHSGFFSKTLRKEIEKLHEEMLENFLERTKKDKALFLNSEKKWEEY